MILFTLLFSATGPPPIPTVNLQEVALTLIKHGRQTLTEILYLTKLRGWNDRILLRKALLVLVQQNCVNVFLKVNEHEHQSEYVYDASMERMLQINRMPRFLDYIRSEMTHYESALVETLLHHGRLRLAQMPDAVQAVWKSQGLEMELHNFDIQELKNAIQCLVSERLIERVPLCTLSPPIAPKRQSNKSSTIAKRRVQARAAYDDEDSIVREAENTLHWSRYSMQRFSLDGIPEFEDLGEALLKGGVPHPTETQAGEIEHQDNHRSAKRKRGLTAPPVRGSTHSATGTASGTVYSTVLWRVNNEGFQRKFLLQEILKVIVEAYELSENEMMRSLVQVMLSAAEFSSFRQSKATLLSSVSFEEICKESKKLRVSLSTEDIRKGLQFLVGNLKATAGDSLITTISSTYESTYRIDAEKCMSLGRRLALMSILRQKYGQVACRIWNMLLHEQQMEQKLIAEKAMVSNIEAREALYAMLKDGFLTLQDIPRNADRAPSRTVYTWRASLTTASVRIAVDLYKTAGNIMARLATETLARAELFEMVELVSAGRLDPAQLNENDLQKMQKVTRALETAAMRIDSQLILFEDTLQL